MNTLNLRLVRFLICGLSLSFKTVCHGSETYGYRMITNLK